MKKVTGEGLLGTFTNINLMQISVERMSREF